VSARGRTAYRTLLVSLLAVYGTYALLYLTWNPPPTVWTTLDMIGIGVAMMLLLHLGIIPFAAGYRAALRRHRHPDEPEPGACGPTGARIIHINGTVSECAILADPEPEDGMARYLVEPPPGVALRPLAGDTLEIDSLPDDCAAVAVPTAWPADVSPYDIQRELDRMARWIERKEGPDGPHR